MERGHQDEFVTRCNVCSLRHWSVTVTLIEIWTNQFTNNGKSKFVYSQESLSFFLFFQFCFLALVLFFCFLIQITLWKVKMFICRNLFKTNLVFPFSYLHTYCVFPLNLIFRRYANTEMLIKCRWHGFITLII